MALYRQPRMIALAVVGTVGALVARTVTVLHVEGRWRWVAAACFGVLVAANVDHLRDQLRRPVEPDVEVG